MHVLSWCKHEKDPYHWWRWWCFLFCDVSCFILQPFIYLLFWLPSKSHRLFLVLLCSFGYFWTPVVFQAFDTSFFLSRNSSRIKTRLVIAFHRIRQDSFDIFVLSRSSWELLWETLLLRRFSDFKWKPSRSVCQPQNLTKRLSWHEADFYHNLRKKKVSPVTHSIDCSVTE